MPCTSLRCRFVLTSRNFTPFASNLEALRRMRSEPSAQTLRARVFREKCYLLPMTAHTRVRPRAEVRRFRYRVTFLMCGAAFASSRAVLPEQLDYNSGEPTSASSRPDTPACRPPPHGCSLTGAGSLQRKEKLGNTWRPPTACPLRKLTHAPSSRSGAVVLHAWIGGLRPTSPAIERDQPN